MAHCNDKPDEKDEPHSETNLLELTLKGNEISNELCWIYKSGVLYQNHYHINHKLWLLKKGKAYTFAYLTLWMKNWILTWSEDSSLTITIRGKLQDTTQLIFGIVGGG